MNTIDQIQSRLWDMRDADYAAFQSKLTPGIEPEKFIGVRTPQLKDYAKELVRSGEYEDFIRTLPHEYFEEQQLQAFIISNIKDFDECIRLTEAFLPYVNNWATCDQLLPSVYKKHKKELLPYVEKWLSSGETYTIRFGIGMLMKHFLDDDFDVSYMNKVANIRSDEYYVNMMIAWYFATALAKQYVPALSVLLEHRLDVWTHNKAIQKAIESRRITDEDKEYLRSLKRK